MYCQLVSRNIVILCFPFVRFLQVCYAVIFFDGRLNHVDFVTVYVFSK